MATIEIGDETYQDLAAQIAQGKVVHYEGRSASSIAQLDLLVQSIQNTKWDPKSAEENLRYAIPIPGAENIRRMIEVLSRESMTSVADLFTKIEARLASIEAQIGQLPQSAPSKSEPSASSPASGNGPSPKKGASKSAQASSPSGDSDTDKGVDANGNSSPALDGIAPGPTDTSAIAPEG